MEARPFDHIRQIATLTRQELEETSTQFTKSFYMGEHLLLCKLLTRYKMYLDARDVGVVPNILMDGYWESWITKFIAQTVQPGNICIDAGANFGYYSLVLGELAGKEGKTVAIEPNSYLCKLLSFTSNLNEHHFEVVHKALSNEKDELTLSIPTHFWGGATIRKEKVDDSIMQETVQADTLDQIVKELGLPRVDFIKMDCEGVEPQIFEGMREIIKQNPQLKMVMEYSPFMYKDAKGFTEFLLSKFEVGEVTSDSSIKKYSETDISYLTNLSTHIDLYLELKQA